MKSHVQTSFLNLAGCWTQLLALTQEQVPDQSSNPKKVVGQFTFGGNSLRGGTLSSAHDSREEQTTSWYAETFARLSFLFPSGFAIIQVIGLKTE
jgi:hypothetical protein